MRRYIAVFVLAIIIGGIVQVEADFTGGGGGVGGNGGTVVLGGVVTGPSSANVFNSTNTAGNAMNNALVITNPAHNSQIDLSITDTVGGAEIAMAAPSPGAVGVKNFSLIQSFTGSTVGGEVEFGAIGGSFAHTTTLICDSDDIDGGGVTPGYCYVPSGGGAAGFKAPSFVFNVIYSVAGTPIPAAAASNNHARACVSDATACTNNTTYTGGAGTPCELWSNGTNWKESGSGC